MNEIQKKRWSKMMEGKPYIPSRGVGDTIAKITSAVGLKPCGGCKQRQEWLNKKLPYKQNESDN
jgi:hypothetical protein